LPLALAVGRDRRRQSDRGSSGGRGMWPCTNNDLDGKGESGFDGGYSGVQFQGVIAGAEWANNRITDVSTGISNWTLPFEKTSPGMSANPFNTCSNNSVAHAGNGISENGSNYDNPMSELGNGLLGNVYRTNALQNLKYDGYEANASIGTNPCLAHEGAINRAVLEHNSIASTSTGVALQPGKEYLFWG
jgi:hypothetical protein